MFLQRLPALLVLLLLASCTAPAPQELLPTPIVSTPQAPTRIPDLTATPTVEPTIQPSPTTIPATAPDKVLVNAANLNMRSGPGMLFQVVTTFIEGTELEPLARTPSGDWLKVKSSEDITGWMSAGLLSFQGDLKLIPEEIITDAIILNGKIIDTDGKPMDGVSLAVTRRLDSSTNRMDVSTTENGEFHVFLPQGFPGTWEISIVGMDCKSSLVDENCNLRQHFVYYGNAAVIVPPSRTIALVYEVASTTLTGNVVNSLGEGIGNIQVFAERKDGAYSYTLPNNRGEFKLPLSPGEWVVYTIGYNPRVEGTPISLEISEGETPQPVELIAPGQ